MWWHNFLRQLLREDVIEATRSWFANLTAVASTLCAVVLTGFLYWGSWSAESESVRVWAFFLALLLTHIEVLVGIFYLHRLALKAIELKGGNVELEVSTEQTTAKVVGSVEEAKEIVKEVKQDDEVLRKGSRRVR